MTHYYAQIDTNLVCFAITETSGYVEQTDMISVSSFDTTLLGKVWSDGQWVDPPPAA